MLRNIANSDNPIQGLVELALKAKGADINSQTVRRYTDMLQTALEIDNGVTHQGGISDFIDGLPGDDKFGAVVQELASTLNASDQEVDQFMYLAGSVGAIICGDDPELIEQEAFDYLDVPEEPEDDGQLYAHLQEHEREMRIAIEEYNRKQNEPEVHHFEEVSKNEGI